MAMHQFKAESKKLLDLMINSIYTNREIFLRELISNASDACDKRYFKSLTDTTIGITKDDLKIHIQPDKDSRTLTISDNGIGMDKDDLDRNLASLSNGHIEYLVTRHIPLQSFQALTAFAECVIKGTKPQRRNNYVHMDILHRRNLDNY